MPKHLEFESAFQVLPGHTAGHVGFYSARFNLLFVGDLFASYRLSAHLPPPFLNSCPEQLEDSLRQVKELAPRFIIPNHYSGLDGALHRERFDRLVEREIGASASLK